MIRPGIGLAGAGVLASLPFWTQDLLLAAGISPRFLIYVGTQALIFAIFAMSLDLLLGYAGLPSFGHAAFYGLGAYACAFAALRGGVDDLLALLLAGAALTALLALPLGALALRTRGIYFLMLTLALAQMLWGLAHDWVSLTRGTDGLIGIHKPTLPGLSALGVSFDDRVSFYLLVLALALACYLLLEALVRSPFGHTLEAIRESELRMCALGVPTFRYRLAAFAIAGALAGVAGVLAALANGYATPDLLYWTGSGLVLVAVIVGGARTLLGPVAGAFLVLISQLYLSAFTDRWELVLGGLFIGFVLFRPGGLAGAVRRL
jgi:branched-chain amino acid transport system permease protein